VPASALRAHAVRAAFEHAAPPKRANFNSNRTTVLVWQNNPTTPKRQLKRLFDELGQTLPESTLREACVRFMTLRFHKNVIIL
jgi:hypothetical protein